MTYRLVATGTVRQAAGVLGDPTCTSGTAGSVPSPRGTVVVPPDSGDGEWDGWSGWSRHEGSDHAASPWAAPTADSSGLLVNGALRWEGDCRADHTYETWFTPTTRQRLQLRYVDPDPGDDTGSLTVYVARDDITRASLVR